MIMIGLNWMMHLIIDQTQFLNPPSADKAVQTYRIYQGTFDPPCLLITKQVFLDKCDIF
jgi:hypothetical protein